MFPRLLIKNFVKRYLKNYSSIKPSLFPLGVKIDGGEGVYRGIVFKFKSLKFGIKGELLKGSWLFSFELVEPEIKIDVNDKKKQTKMSEIKLPEKNINVFIKKGKIISSFGDRKITISGINGNFINNERTHSFRGYTENISYNDSKIAISGYSRLHVYFKEGELILHEFRLNSEGVDFKGKGRINFIDPSYKFRISFLGNPKIFQEKIGLPFVIDGNSMGNVYIRKRKNSSLKITLSSSFREAKIGDLTLRNIYTTVNLFRDIFRFYVKFGRSDITGMVKGEDIIGRFSNLKLNDFLKIYDFEMPFSAISRGTFRYRKDIIRGKIKLSGIEGKYPPLEGFLSFTYNVRKEKLNVSSEDLKIKENSFLVSGGVNFLDEKENIKISGKFDSLFQLIPVVEYYTEEDFSFFSPDGEGRFELEVYGDINAPEVRLKSNFRHFILSNSEIGEGDIYISSKGKESRGKFFFKSKKFDFKGDFYSEKNQTKFTILASNFSIDEVRKIFKINAEIGGVSKGRVEGKIFNENKYEISAETSGEYVKYYGENFVNYKTEFFYSYNNGEGTIELKEFSSEYKGGDFNADIILKSRKEIWNGFDINITCRGANLSKFHPLFSGKIDFKVSGEGSFKGETVEIPFKISDFSIEKKKTDIKGKAVLNLFPDKFQFSSSFSGNLIKGGIKGFIDTEGEKIKAEAQIRAKELDFFLPWGGNRGSVSFDMMIYGDVSSPYYAGVVEVEGEKFIIPELPQSFDNFKFYLFVNNNLINIKNSSCKLGGGDVDFEGYIKFRDEETIIDDIDVRIKGRNVHLYPLEKVDGVIDGDIRIYGKREFYLAGSILVKRAEWRREFEEPVEFSKKVSLSTEGKKFLRKLFYDVRFISSSNSWINNSLFKGEVSYDFKVKGNYINPVIVGSFNVIKGKVLLSDQPFNVVKGVVNFDNPYYIDPYLDIEAESFIKDYRVNFSLKGYLSHPVPELRSSPPLPEHEILTLIALGEAYRRVYSTESASMYSSSSLISTEITDFLKKTFFKKFKIDTMRVEPFIPSSSGEPTPRISIGKKIMKNLLLIYAFEFSSQKTYTLYVEYHITPKISIIGLRDRDGAFNIDIRYAGRK